MTKTKVEKRVELKNPHLEKLLDDKLYHFGMNKLNFDFEKNFGDVKYVCTGGSASRFEMYAKAFAEETDLKCSENLSHSDRFVMYKTGPVLWVNHGMGTPSMSIMLNETLKLLHYAKATDVCFFRIGTSGGVGVQPGTVIISNGAINGALEECHILYVNGKLIKHPAVLDAVLSQELFDTAKDLGITAAYGKTLCADDFYEGQMRLDGAFCDYNEEDKFSFLRTLKDKGVCNIEMEATGFASITHRAGVRGKFFIIRIPVILL